jgi:hypothetical protein
MVLPRLHSTYLPKYMTDCLPDDDSDDDDA